MANFSDSFNRSNGSPGANWTVVNGRAGAAIPGPNPTVNIALTEAEVGVQS